MPMAGLCKIGSRYRLLPAARPHHAPPCASATVSSPAGLRSGPSTVMVQLAAEAALSRSAFYDRFSKALGLPPMEYLLAWRMALARELLRSQSLSIQQVAERVGYGSASTFSTAFSRAVGVAPGRFGRT